MGHCIHLGSCRQGPNRSDQDKPAMAGSIPHRFIAAARYAPRTSQLDHFLHATAGVSDLLKHRLISASTRAFWPASRLLLIYVPSRTTSAAFLWRSYLDLRSALKGHTWSRLKQVSPLAAWFRENRLRSPHHIRIQQLNRLARRKCRSLLKRFTEISAVGAGFQPCAVRGADGIRHMQ